MRKLLGSEMGKTSKTCPCGQPAFVKVRYGVVCLKCYRNGVELENPTPQVRPRKKSRSKRRKTLPAWIQNWKPVYALYMRSPEWSKKRLAKMKSVGFRCENIACNSKLTLETHHLTYTRLGKERLSDLRVLCKVCHMDAHDNLPFPVKYYQQVSP